MGPSPHDPRRGGAPPSPLNDTIGSPRAYLPWRGGLRTPAWKCFRFTPAFLRKATSPWLTPLEERAPHAREEGTTPTEMFPLSATGLSPTRPRS